jgi:hypothetical protein
MENYPFDTVGLTVDVIDRYHNSYQVLKEEFNIQPTGHIDFDLQQFEVFKNCKDINLRGSYVIKQDCGDSYILFIEIHYKLSGTKHVIHHSEHQVWALAYVKHNFGRVLIRRETLTDKLLELIHPLELDFKEDKAFSDTFYVVVNDHVKASVGMDRNFRNAVMDIRDNDFMIEIVDHTLIIGNYDPIVAEKSTHLAEFVARVAEAC